MDVEAAYLAGMEKLLRQYIDLAEPEVPAEARAAVEAIELSFNQPVGTRTTRLALTHCRGCSFGSLAKIYSEMPSAEGLVNSFRAAKPVCVAGLARAAFAKEGEAFLFPEVGVPRTVLAALAYESLMTDWNNPEDIYSLDRRAAALAARYNR